MRRLKSYNVQFYFKYFSFCLILKEILNTFKCNCINPIKLIYLPSKYPLKNRYFTCVKMLKIPENAMKILDSKTIFIIIVLIMYIWNHNFIFVSFK